MITRSLVSLLFFLYSFRESFAQGVGSRTSITLFDPLRCENQSIERCLLPRVIDGLFVIAVPLVTIMVLFGGFQIITAGGDPEKFKSGRRTILYAAVGFIVVGLAKSISFIVQSVLQGN